MVGMSDKTKKKQVGRTRRHARVRRHITGTAERPRLAVFRSNRHVVAQVIDDDAGTTLAAASTLEARGSGRRRRRTSTPRPRSASWWPTGPRKPASSKVVFDRGGFRYHGRVAALADAAREAGLEF